MSFQKDGFHGEFSSADASALTEANSRAGLYASGSLTGLTLTSADMVIVTDISVSMGAASLIVRVYDGADTTVSAGETILSTTPAANTSTHVSLSVPHVCQIGTYPKVKTSGAGQVDVRLSGRIVRKGP